jgi:hypothetical protein
MSDLFIWPAKLPEVTGKIPVYRTSIYNSLAYRNADFTKDFTSRLELAKRKFQLTTEPLDRGDRVLYRENDATLEVFRASNSIWWAKRSLVDRDQLSKGPALPEEAEAKERAAAELKRLGLDVKNAVFDSVCYDEVAVREPGAKRPKVLKTAANVIYRFEIRSVPVFGPGAKIKVSLVENGQVSQVLYFWRKPAAEGSTKPLLLEEARAQFMRDPAFLRLSASKAAVEIRSVRFGFYAAPPGEFQRFLIPVYKVEGAVRTSEFERYEFYRYVTAIAMGPEEAKAQGVTPNPAACRVF